MKGRDVCYHHGGRSPRGVASATLKHGRYSEDLPTRLQARYEGARTDPDLLNLTSEISLIDTFTSDALKGLENGESGALWTKLQETWGAYQEAKAEGDRSAELLVSMEISDLIKRGSAPYMIRAETMQLAEARRKLVESEQKRRVAMQDMIDSKQAMMLVVRLTDAVMRHVDDPRTLAAISAEFGAITTYEGPGSS